MLRCNRQLHIWISEADHAFLAHTAQQADTTIGAIVRRLIRLSAKSFDASSPASAVGRGCGASRQQHTNDEGD